MPSWLESAWVDYPLKRSISLPPGPLRHFNVAVLVLSVIYVVVITLINVVAVAYERVTVISTDYDLPYKLWYEVHFLPKSWAPQTRTCNASLIKISEGLTLS